MHGGVWGRQALLSNHGTYCDTSRCKGTVVQEAVTFGQQDRWFSNRYSGPWQFTVYESNRTVDAGAWTAAPCSQDAGSGVG